MDDQKFQIILDSLLERTRKDELNWKTTASSSKFLLVLNDSSVTIESSDSFSTYITFEFKNEKGETVEEFDVTDNKKEYTKAFQIYDLARRKALNSDEIIDKIIKQLKPDSITA